MLDLSADNRDGFEDTDGQLYTSNSFYFRGGYIRYYGIGGLLATVI